MEECIYYAKGHIWLGRIRGATDRCHSMHMHLQQTAFTYRAHIVTIWIMNVDNFLVCSYILMHIHSTHLLLLNIYWTLWKSLWNGNILTIAIEFLLHSAKVKMCFALNFVRCIFCSQVHFIQNTIDVYNLHQCVCVSV